VYEQGHQHRRPEPPCGRKDPRRKRMATADLATAVLGLGRVIMSRNLRRPTRRRTFPFRLVARPRPLHRTPLACTPQCHDAALQLPGTLPFPPTQVVQRQQEM